VSKTKTSRGRVPPTHRASSISNKFNTNLRLKRNSDKLFTFSFIDRRSFSVFLHPFAKHVFTARHVRTACRPCRLLPYRTELSTGRFVKKERGGQIDPLTLFLIFSSFVSFATKPRVQPRAAEPTAVHAP